MQATSSMKIDMQTAATDMSQRALAWVVTLTAGLFFFYAFIQLNLFNSIDSELMTAFHLSASGLGELASMYFYANALFLFPAGILLDRFSTKKLLLFAILISTTGTFIFAATTSLWVAAIGRFMVGTGAAFSFLSCMRLATRWFPPQKMAFVTGVIVTMAMLGGLVAQTPMTLLSQWVGWRQAIVWDGALGILIGLIILLFLQDRPSNSLNTELTDKAQLESLGFLQSVTLVLKNRYNWFGGLYISLLNLPVFVLGALWGIHYLVQVHQLNAVYASYATTVFFLGVIVGSPFYGWLSDRLGRRILPMVMGVILSFSVLLVLLILPHPSLSVLITLFFMIGFFTSSQVLPYPTIAELNPPVLTSTAISIASITVMSSGAIIQPLFGWLMELNWDHTVIQGVRIYSSSDFLRAMIVMPIACLIGLFIALLIKETYCKSQV